MQRKRYTYDQRQRLHKIKEIDFIDILITSFGQLPQNLPSSKFNPATNIEESDIKKNKAVSDKKIIT